MMVHLACVPGNHPQVAPMLLEAAEDLVAARLFVEPRHRRADRLENSRTDLPDNTRPKNRAAFAQRAPQR